jgi:hypothetical protein
MGWPIASCQSCRTTAFTPSRLTANLAVERENAAGRRINERCIAVEVGRATLENAIHHRHGRSTLSGGRFKTLAATKAATATGEAAAAIVAADVPKAAANAAGPMIAPTPVATRATAPATIAIFLSA